MTVAELIRGAFRTLGILAAEETPSAAEESDGLVTLNDMLDSWAGERLALYATLRSAPSLAAGASPQTIGTGGMFDTTRPVRIDRASIEGVADNVETPLRLLSDAEWQGLGDKSSLGRPSALWVERTYPLMQLHFFPIPDVAYTLVLYTWLQLGRFPSVASDFDLPPGYARAIRYNLAKELAPEYGVSLSAEAAFIADESKSTLKRLNERPSYLRCDPAVLQGGYFNLVSGDG
jgi:hypothetical protein